MILPSSAIPQTLRGSRERRGDNDTSTGSSALPLRGGSGVGNGVGNGFGNGVGVAMAAASGPRLGGGGLEVTGVDVESKGQHSFGTIPLNPQIEFFR